MAFIRSRSDSRSRVGDGSPSKEIGGIMEASKDEFPPTLTRTARREAENARLGFPSNAQPRMQSRIPQNLTPRKPPSSSTTSRPPLTHETRPWVSLSSGSSRAMTAVPACAVSSIARSDSMSTQPRNVLRRKQSSVSQEPASLHDQSRSNSGRTSSSSSIPRSQTYLDSHVPHFDRSMTDSPVEIRVAQKVELPRALAQTTTIYPELDRYRDIEIARDGPGSDILLRLATHDLPPPTPLFSGGSTLSGTPSTRFSESPGTGPYSRDTTPTSMSSASPGLVAPVRISAPRVKQASPADTRPPVTRRRAGSITNDNDAFIADPHGLAVVRETVTSSSSNSTVRDGEKKEKKKKRLLALPPPNPPPRKSSQKLTKERGQDASPSKLARTPALPVMRSPSLVKTTRVSSESSHVAVISPQPRATPPSRPSRNGTPDLYSQLGGPVPVIHSNLTSTSIWDRRQSGQLAPSSLPRSTTPSSQDHLMPSRLPVGREPTPAARSASSLGQSSIKAEPGRPTRTPSPSISNFKSKFGLFGRRKTDTEVPKPEKKERASRKGPAAGTGHEGYGRIGATKRRSSSTTNPVLGLTGPLSSSESLASTQSTTDPFLLERMKPVIIAGGQVVENLNTSSGLTQTDSNQSIPLHRSSIDSRNASFGSLSSPKGPRNITWPSAFPRNSTQSRRPSDSSDSEAVAMKSTLAFRRSIQRLRSSPDQESMNLPKPIRTRGITSSSVGSVDTAILTDDSFADYSQPEAGHGQHTKDLAPNKLMKRAKSPRKWNLFSRSQSQPGKPAMAIKEKGEAEEVTAVAATVKPVQTKPVAFYTMMDSSGQEDAEEPDLNEVLREAQVLTPPRPIFNERERRSYTSSQRKAQVQNRPEPRRISQGEQPKAQRQTHTAPKPWPEARSVLEQVPAMISAKRPSRLPQVGRIPKVVTTRPEKASPKSFSRPFNRISLQLQSPRPVLADNDSVAKGPSPDGPSTPKLPKVETVETMVRESPPPTQSRPRDASLDFGPSDKEFFAFAPRKNSECTTSSSSSNSAIPSYVNQIAVVPVSTTPLAEDEIWDEYNDLLGDVPPSATSSRGTPFHLERYESKLSKKASKPLESPTVNMRHATANRYSCETEMDLASSSHFSAEMTARINAAFRFGSEPPTTPFSVSEFVSGYGERNKSSVDVARVPVSSQRSSSSSRQSAAVRTSNSSSASEETPLSQVNLRVGSMTVSKWLSFGHVLFSPAREDLVQVVGSLKRQSILVIDGLGNDDWSFYAAETYPAATFFNLSPRAPLSQEHRSNSFPLSPPNHHQIQYSSHMEKFPFGPDSFTTVVFRFPCAAPEAHYRNIISEARRVLKPGGYVELSILDVDLNNMGNRCRRAVRRLKERANTMNPDYNLSSTADLMLRLLGKRGFVDVKNCRVGVPVANAVATSSGSEGGRKKKKKKKKKKDERSLAEMMNDETEMGDENITKMVAKVGRWWYSRLYENTTAVKGSIWNDKALLTECEEWGTSLKLMVCHAKVPEGRNRVSSV